MDQPIVTYPRAEARAAEAVEQARHLRDAAEVIRRLAAGLTYHPVTGRRPQASPELLDALAAVERVVRAIQEGAEARAIGQISVSDAFGAEQVRRGHAAVEGGVETVVSALGVLRQVLEARDDATLDAPYGRGAPSRHHPGALCTIVAERVEDLARALEVAAVVWANLALRTDQGDPPSPRKLIPG
ncbi:MAG: hypothetical protein QN131_07040 [Armatimonadota bacterium]|nr:hypothetical protein [Armatimonadota bacterium]MDR7549675.1 hypothetical protein [Armatimonadota bacterium]